MGDNIDKYFAYSHLPEHLQAVSKPFHDLLQHINVTSKNTEEARVAKRKLLEAKDAAVRAALG